MQYFLILFSLLLLAPWMSAAETEPPSIRTGTWQQARLALTPRTEVTAAVLDNRIYVIGRSPLRFGNLLRLSVSDAVEVYDPGKDRWYLVAPLPKLLHHAVAVVASQRLFVLGGFAPSLTSVWNPVNSVFEYLPSAGRWREVAPMLTARSGIAAAVLDRMVVVGGESDAGTFVENEAYWPKTETWVTLPPLPTPRYGLAAAVVGGRLYIRSVAESGRVRSMKYLLPAELMTSVSCHEKSHHLS